MHRSELHLSLLRLGRATLQLGWPHRFARLTKPDDWLRVHARIDCPEGIWSFIDESLTVAEANALVAWLRTPTTRNAPTFIEPCISFAAAPLPGKPDSVLLAITFMGEASPPWIHGTDHVWSDGWTLQGETRTTDIAAFADGLAQSLAQ